MIYMYALPRLLGTKQNITTLRATMFQGSICGGSEDVSHSCLKLIKSTCSSLYSITSILHHLLQIRLESMLAGKSWPVEKAGSKRHTNWQLSTTLTCTSGISFKQFSEPLPQRLHFALPYIAKFDPHH